MRRWTSTYRFAWTPIITFGTRRLDLLEWVEENLEPVAFTEGHDHVGIALVNHSIRMAINRNGVILEDGVGSDAGISPLSPALDGIFEILKPKSLVLTSASLAWSEALVDQEYNPARAQFATMLSGFSELESGLQAIDASTLMDLESPDYQAQVEWGIVSDSELVERLTRPSVGRLAENRPEATLSGIAAEDLPPASLFVDTSIYALGSGEITDKAGMELAAHDVDIVSEEIARAIYSRVVE